MEDNNNNDEAQKAQTAQEEEVTIFDKIARKEIPANIIYEDDIAMAFRDVAPITPTHFLVIPKNRNGLSQLRKATKAHIGLLGHLMWVVGHVAMQENLEEGYRVVINDGKQGCQSVYHLHIHVIGGKQLSWPPGI
eukprot:403350334